MKRPAFQFYTKDWKSNLKLRRCSEAARGAWIEILCALHDCEEYGVARFPLKELVEVAGTKMKSARELVDKGVLKGGDAHVPAFFHTPKHAGKSLPPVQLLAPSEGPLWYSSRMVRDEWIRSRQGGETKFSTDNQPSKNTRSGDPPKQSPTGRSGERSGDGAAVASASAVISPPVVEVVEGGAPTETAGGEIKTLETTPDPRFVATQALLRKAKTRDVDTCTSMIEQWLATATDSQIQRAVNDACKSAQGGAIGCAYIDPIVVRIVTQDRAIREASDRRVAETQTFIDDQRSKPVTGKPEGFPDLKFLRTAS